MASIVVVRGGRSLEREISLRSGHHVAGALRHLGHDVHEVDVDEHLTAALAGADAAFIALHGRDGEDGTIQSILETLGLPYTGSAPLACHLCFDKPIAKGLLARDGIPCPDGFVLADEAVRRMGAAQALREGTARLGYPIVVKPATQGSALGLSIVRSPDELSSAAMGAFNYGERVVLERFVDGRDVVIGLLGQDLRALPPVEIRTPSGVFDFEARVTLGAAEYLCPAEMDDATAEQAQALALAAARVCGVRDFARVDLRLGPQGPVVLDVKTSPGMTETSLVPLAAAEDGVDFASLVGEILDLALRRGRTEVNAR